MRRAEKVQTFFSPYRAKYDLRVDPEQGSSLQDFVLACLSWILMSQQISCSTIQLSFHLFVSNVFQSSNTENAALHHLVSIFGKYRMMVRVCVCVFLYAEREPRLIEK